MLPGRATKSSVDRLVRVLRHKPTKAPVRTRREPDRTNLLATNPNRRHSDHRRAIAQLRVRHDKPVGMMLTPLAEAALCDEACRTLAWLVRPHYLPRAISQRGSGAGVNYELYILPIDLRPYPRELRRPPPSRWISLEAQGNPTGGLRWSGGNGTVEHESLTRIVEHP